MYVYTHISMYIYNIRVYRVPAKQPIYMYNFIIYTLWHCVYIVYPQRRLIYSTGFLLDFLERTQAGI